MTDWGTLERMRVLMLEAQDRPPRRVSWMCSHGTREAMPQRAQRMTPARIAWGKAVLAPRIPRTA
jgi:hypothetical protein